MATYPKRRVWNAALFTFVNIAAEHKKLNQQCHVQVHGRVGIVVTGDSWWQYYKDVNISPDMH